MGKSASGLSYVSFSDMQLCFPITLKTSINLKAFGSLVKK